MDENGEVEKMRRMMKGCVCVEGNRKYGIVDGHHHKLQQQKVLNCKN